MSPLDRLPRWLRRAAFFLYVPVLFVGTHWPALQVPGEGRPDLWVHLAAFGLWTTLFIACGFFGPVLSTRNIASALLIAPLYAAFDEGTQAIPALRRTAAWDDYAFNCTGIVLACTIAWLVSRLWRPRPISSAADA